MHSEKQKIQPSTVYSVCIRSKDICSNMSQLVWMFTTPQNSCKFWNSRETCWWAQCSWLLPEKCSPLTAQLRSACLQFYIVLWWYYIVYIHHKYIYVWNNNNKGNVFWCDWKIHLSKSTTNIVMLLVDDNWHCNEDIFAAHIKLSRVTSSKTICRGKHCCFVLHFSTEHVTSSELSLLP